MGSVDSRHVRRRIDLKQHFIKLNRKKGKKDKISFALLLPVTRETGRVLKIRRSIL